MQKKEGQSPSVGVLPMKKLVLKKPEWKTPTGYPLA
jgi:hypothetical protein